MVNYKIKLYFLQKIDKNILQTLKRFRNNKKNFASII